MPYIPSHTSLMRDYVFLVLRCVRCVRRYLAYACASHAHRAFKRKSFSLDLLNSRFKYLMEYLSAKRIKSQWGSSQTSCSCGVWAILTHVERIHSLGMRFPSQEMSNFNRCACMNAQQYTCRYIMDFIQKSQLRRMILCEHKSQSENTNRYENVVRCACGNVIT